MRRGLDALGHLQALAAPLPGLWALTGAMILACIVLVPPSKLSIEPGGILIAVGASLACIGAGAYWTFVRPISTLRAMALATGFLVAFTGALGVLHYWAATLGLPLIDGRLAAFEAALGFDWRAYAGLIDGAPWVADGLALAYHTSGPQVAFAIIVLAASYRFGRLWAYVRLFAVTLLVVIAMSSLFPAAGAYAHYGQELAGEGGLATVGGTWHLDHLAMLRGSGGTIAFGDIRGLATFPSFHVCLAVLTAWALRPVRWIGPAALVLNGMIIVATVTAGGHYLPDLAAGGALAIAAIAGQEIRRRQPLQRHPLLMTASASGIPMAAGAPPGPRRHGAAKRLHLPHDR